MPRWFIPLILITASSLAGLGLLVAVAPTIEKSIEAAKIAASERAEITLVERLHIKSPDGTGYLYTFSPRSRPGMTCFVLRGPGSFGGMHCWVGK